MNNRVVVVKNVCVGLGIKLYPPNPKRCSSFEHEAFGEDKAYEGINEEMLKILGGGFVLVLFPFSFSSNVFWRHLIMILQIVYRPFNIVYRARS